MVGWNLAATTEDDTEGAEKLWAELAMKRAHLDVKWTEDEVEQEVTWCQVALRSVLNATAKIIRIHAESKRWWNAILK